MNSAAIRALTDLIWDQLESPDDHVFMLFDGAACAPLLDALYGADPPQFECLYRGDLGDDMAEVAPYIVRLERDSAFTAWALSGWGEHWGIIAVSPLAFAQTRLHFRKLNLITGPDQNPLLFRYYDPRVLRVFLPVCDAAQLSKLFGPIQRFYVEGDTPGTTQSLALADGQLVQRQHG